MENRRKDIDKSTQYIVYYLRCISHMHAAVAQSVERRLGKAEVGGSIPLGSLIFKGLQEITSSESLFLLQKRRIVRKDIYKGKKA